MFSFNTVLYSGQALYSMTFFKLQQFFNALKPELIRSILCSFSATIDHFTVVSSPLSFVSNQN